jgi:CheY-like chemotaxis protein
MRLCQWAPSWAAPPNQGNSLYANGDTMLLRISIERSLLPWTARDSAVQNSAMKSQLVADASHDLRQSLEAMWSLQTVLARDAENTNYAPHIASLEKAMRNLERVLSSLVDINRLETDVAAKQIQTTELTPAPLAGRAIKVLHIEDDPSVARSMARLLRLHGYEVATAATRDEAMQHLELQGLRPDLILADSQLGVGLTGDELVAAIAARLKFKPPTIMLTSVTACQPEKVKSIADRILPKPVDVDVLLHEIEILLGTRP